MRRLTKGPKPAVLVANDAAWTTAYVAAKGTPAERSREKWRHAEIKDALRAEVAGLCAYCEGRVEDVSFLHVEHIVPKSLRPDLAHAWPNLTGACAKCNTAKGQFYDETDGVLNPYVDRVDEHVLFFGALVDFHFGSVKGEVTVTLLRLNRLELVTARAERITNVGLMVHAWEASAGAKKAVLESAIRLDVEEGEFSASVRAFVVARGFPMFDGTPDAAEVGAA